MAHWPHSTRFSHRQQLNDMSFSFGEVLVLLAVGGWAFGELSDLRLKQTSTNFQNIDVK